MLVKCDPYLEKVKEVYDTTSIDEVNSYLKKEGWELYKIFESQPDVYHFVLIRF